MKRWAIKHAAGYVQIEDGGEYDREFNGVRLFKTKKEARENILDQGVKGNEEIPVQIEIKEVK